MRDLKKDLELCEKAENGPWITGGASGRMITRQDGYFGGGFLADVDLKSNAQFIAESRDGWPYAIKKAIELESQLTAANQEITELREALEYALNNITIHHHDKKFGVECFIAIEARDRLIQALSGKKEELK